MTVRRPSRRVLVAALALALLLTLASVGAGSSPPTQVCGPCGEGFEDAAAERGVDVTVERSAVAVRVHGNGSATWTVRNVLADPTPLRANGSVLRALAGDVAWTRQVVGDRTAFSSHLDGDAVVVTFRTPAFANRSVGGSLVTDGLHPEDSTSGLSFRGDRLSVTGPEGTVAVAPASGVDVEDGAAVWRDDFEQSHVAFARDDGPVAVGTARVALLAETAGYLVPDLLRVLTVPLVGLAMALVTMAAGDYRAMGQSARRRVAGLLAAVGLLGAVSPIVGRPVLLGLDAALLGVGLGYAAVAGLVAALPDRPSSRRVLGVAAAGTAVAGVGAFLAADGPPAATLPWVVRIAGLVGAVALLLPFGYAVGGQNRRWPVAAGVLAGVGLTVAPSLPTTGRLGGVILVGLGIVLVVLVVVLGGPLFALGYGLAAEADGSSGGTPGNQ